jgi:serine/threonine-protein kinase RsbW
LPAEELDFELAGGPYAATAARLALNDLEARLDPVLAQDLRLLVSEAVTNSVKHAGIGPEDSLGLKVTLHVDRVRVEVRDDGPQFDAEPRPPTLDHGEDDDRPGWGLFLVDQLADRWGVHHAAGNTVWFELGTGGASAAA